MSRSRKTSLLIHPDLNYSLRGWASEEFLRPGINATLPHFLRLPRKQLHTAADHDLLAFLNHFVFEPHKASNI
jgi:hypothetical protein